MDFRILGPLDVRAGGRSIQLGAAKQRAVLALLLLRAGEVVPMDQIIDELWGDNPPASAVKLVQTYVSRLRKELAGAGDDVILTRAPGYIAEVEAGELDVARFVSSIAEARRAASDGRREEASNLFAEALAMWRGRPAEDVVLQRNADAEIDRLEELRAAAQLESLAVEVDLGRNARAIGELKSRIADDPYAERAHALLMLALYREGRQAESLEVFRNARETLVDELGVEPGPELQALHRRILAQDPALAIPARASPTSPINDEPSAVGAGSKRRRGKLVPILGLAVVLIAVAVAIVTVGGGGSAPRLAPNQVGLIEFDGSHVASSIRVGRRPSSVALSGQRLWTANVDDRTVSEVDLADARVVRSIGTRTAPTAIAATADAAWVAEEFANRVERIDARTGTIDAAIPVGTSPGAIATGYGSIWVVNRGDGTVSRIDPSTLKVIAVVRVGPGPAGIAAGSDGVWVSLGLSKRVVEIDPDSGSVARRVGVRYAPGAIAVGGGDVWVAHPFDDALTSINAKTGGLKATVDVGDRPNAIAVADGSVWVADELGRAVQRIDPASGRPDGDVSLTAYPSSLAPGDGGIWVTTEALG
jgi:YVTN family beta-propeller protein